MGKNEHLHLYNTLKCIHHHHYQKLHKSYSEDDTMLVAGGVNLAVNDNSCKSESYTSLHLPPLLDLAAYEQG